MSDTILSIRGLRKQYATGVEALAMLRGRSYALPEDVADLVGDVLRHRLVLSYEALADGMSADQIIQRITAKLPKPDKPLHGRPVDTNA